MLNAHLKSMLVVLKGESLHSCFKFPNNAQLLDQVQSKRDEFNQACDVADEYD